MYKSTYRPPTCTCSTAYRVIDPHVHVHVGLYVLLYCTTCHVVQYNSKYRPTCTCSTCIKVCIYPHVHVLQHIDPHVHVGLYVLLYCTICHVVQYNSTYMYRPTCRCSACIKVHIDPHVM